MIITIGRQLGSGGLQIGQIVAKTLNLDFYDKQLLFEAANDSGMKEEFFSKVDEKARSKFPSFNIFGMRGALGGSSYVDVNSLSVDNLFLLQSNTMERLASSSERGVVFIGRCANFVLRNHSDLFRIFISADLDFRIKQVMLRNACSEQEAAELIEKVDKQRSNYNEYFANGGWGVASNYDLTLNSSKFGIEGTAQIIVDILSR